MVGSAAAKSPSRGTRQQYLQWFPPTRSWRFRRVVPDHLRSIIGKREFTQTLRAKDRGAAERLVRPLIEQTDRIIALAEAGNWPEVEDDDIEALAEGWWRLFQLERSRLITNPQGLPSWPNGRERLDDINSELWALASDDDLSRSVRRFLAGPRQWPSPSSPRLNSRPSGSLSRRPETLRRNCRETRRRWGGCCGTAEFSITTRRAAMSARAMIAAHAISRILDMIEGLEIDPRQIVAAIEGRHAAPVSSSNPPLDAIWLGEPR